MIFGRRHLEEVLRVYVARYGHRPHRGLDLGAALAAPAPAQSVSPVLPSGSVGVFVTGFAVPPLTLRVHEDPVPPGWNRTAHGIVTRLWSCTMRKQRPGVGQATLATWATVVIVAQ